MSFDFNLAVPVSCVAEEYEHVAAHPCERCGHAWQVRMQALVRDGEGRHYDRVDVVCPRCDSCEAFLFDLSTFFPSTQKG
jgi:hypothetical protein